MKKPIEMLVRVLANGGRVEQDGYVYAMAEDGSLCVVMHDDAGNERPMQIDYDLAALNRMANDIGVDELWMKCCALQLRGDE